MRLSNDRTVARCSEGMSAVDERLAERSLDREDERPGGEQEQRDHEVAGQPEQHEQDDVERSPPMSRALVRRPKRRRTRDTMSPPTIWTPATIAAARPAIP